MLRTPRLKLDELRRSIPPYLIEGAESLAGRGSNPSRPLSAIGGPHNCKLMRRMTGTWLTVSYSSVYPIAVRIDFLTWASIVGLGLAKTGCTRKGTDLLFSFRLSRSGVPLPGASLLRGGRSQACSLLFPAAQETCRRRK